MVRFSIIVAVCITTAVVCLPPVSFANSAPASHYVRHEKKDGVIIFVHGIFGDPTDTWTCPKGTYWPTLLLKDTSFKDYDVYVASYDSPRLGNGMTIEEIVLNLHNRFENDQVFQHREVVFVAHSLGGLIVQRFILKYREYAPKVRFIYFFATPESGAQIAKLGSYFSRDPLLKEMLDGDENDYLLSLETDWREANFQNVHRFCAYEKKPTRIGMIVDRLSATRGCEHTLPINEDHLGIVKPCSIYDDSYIALRNAVIDNPIQGKAVAFAKPPSKTPSVITPPKLNGPRLGIGPEAYKDISDEQVGQWAIEEADKIDEMAKQAAASGLPANGSNWRFTNWKFTNDFIDCCVQDLKDLRTELLRRLGPPGKDSDEIAAWIGLFPETKYPIPQPDTIDSVSVTYYAPYLRRLGLKLKRRAVPRTAPEPLHFSEVQVPPDKLNIPYNIVATITTDKIVSSGYVVVQFDGRLARASCVFVDSKLLLNTGMLDNDDLKTFLKNQALITTYALEIGKTPLKPDTPVHVLASSAMPLCIAPR